MISAELPDFLLPWESRLPGQPSSVPRYQNALFKYKRLPLSSHTLWWPSSTASTSTLLIFIPGNPGLVDFYTPFLNDIHQRSEGQLPILARAHLGHTPHIDTDKAVADPSFIGLAAQIESILELIDVAKASYKRLVLVGHSVGSWLVLQAMKARAEAVHSVFLLFPTIAHIGRTPNGRKLSWVFRPPFPRILSQLSVVAGLLPLRLVSHLFGDWPLPQILVLRSLLQSPSAVYASLSMANEEMQTIKDVDMDLLRTFEDRIHLYFAEEDDWVGEQKDSLTQLLKKHPSDVKLVHGDADIPHAFCINHGEQLAKQCFAWLKDGTFL